MKTLLLAKKRNNKAARLKATLKSEDVSAADITVDDDVAMMEYDPTYKRKEKELLDALSTCNDCKKRPCLLDKHSRHRTLNAQMIRIWVLSLVSVAAMFEDTF